jgi:hypothetical protein
MRTYIMTLREFKRRRYQALRRHISDILFHIFDGVCRTYNFGRPCLAVRRPESPWKISLNHKYIHDGDIEQIAEKASVRVT